MFRETVGIILQVLVEAVQLDDMTDIAAFQEIIMPVPTTPQPRFFTLSAVQSLVC